MKAVVMTAWLKVEILFPQQSIYKLRVMLSCWELDAFLPSASAYAQMVHSLWTWRKDETLRETPCHRLLCSPAFQFCIFLFVQDGGNRTLFCCIPMLAEAWLPRRWTPIIPVMGRVRYKGSNFKVSLPRGGKMNCILQEIVKITPVSEYKDRGVCFQWLLNISFSMRYR